MRIANAGGWLLLALGASSCGYHLTASTWALRDQVRSLHVGAIANQTREFGLDKDLGFAFEREVKRHGIVHVSEDPGGGDAEFTGTIRVLRIEPVAFDSNDEALQYKVTVVADFYLRSAAEGKTVWKAIGLQESEEFSSVARVVVSSSSEFQRQPLDAADLPKFTAIQLAESSKRQALDRLVENLVRDAYALMAEDF